MLLGESMERRNIDDIDKELEQLIAFTENGGFGDRDAEKAHDRKIQFLLSLRAQEISRNKATDSDLSDPDLSAVPYLIPLTEVKHLDPELWERCRFSLSSGGDDPKAWDKAVRTATVVLEERLRKLGKTESINRDATGEGIVNIIFAGKNPVLGGKLDEKQLKAYRDLYVGMMAVFRNPYAHRIIDPSPEVGGAIIVFIDLLLKTLDDIDWNSSGGEA
jgi:Protein of unknown function (Hypoth_ymh)